jgi:endonuclease/exonuclease/phosphatase family metal-dependent hydrolase
VAGLINYYEPDFVGAQEVLHHQLTYLLEKLPGYDFAGGGRDDGATKGEYSCIFYKKEKYTVLEQKTFWLSPTPDSVSRGWDAALNRVCTFMLVRDKKTKQSFWVFNTHFDHMGKQARLESARLIIEKIHELNTKSLPAFLIGDLNATPDEAPVTFIHSALKDTRQSAELVYGPAETFNAFRFTEKPERRIDYIFMTDDGRLRVTKFATLTDSYALRYPSDHFPVMATVEMEKVERKTKAAGQ